MSLAAPPLSARILIVDDEWKMRDALARGLRKVEGWQVDTAACASEAFARLAQHAFDLLVLDWMLPDQDGLVLVRHARERQLRTSVLMITARGEVGDRVCGIDHGADDYLVKPFAFEELLARCRAILRRHDTSHVLALPGADLTLDPRSRLARRSGLEAPLTPLESALLEFLLEHANAVVSRDTIAREVWRKPVDAELTNTINIHIARLRQKLDAAAGPALIHTIVGQGYLCGRRE
jgi:DNA-binding response OmpR family regulator